jgi:hypothetical protein
MKEEKRCWIRTRYLVKRTGSICAKIVNGGGTEYTTCLHRNGSHSCTCKAGERGVLCYHVKHLQAKEAERKAAVSAQTGKDSQKREQEAAMPITERMERAPLTGNRPFRLMR